MAEALLRNVFGAEPARQKEADLLARYVNRQAPAVVWCPVGSQAKYQGLQIVVGKVEQAVAVFS